ncbi:MAG: tRNA epoxyqueuosine(34) reductase QueG [Bacteroidales bacterium]|nr:tRNA epoxyqueuosine(34) reductase QueG [Bacteroidales bacterium]
MSISECSGAIKEEALRLGFADCGFSKAELLPEDATRLQEWLSSGYHARMGYMAKHFEKRTDPTKLVEGARSVISVLYNYYTDKKQKDPEAPVISTYAFGRDYHLVMREKMNLLFDFIKSLHPDAEGRVFVDSAPVLDRTWAKRSGLGWIGKNSNLISRKAGSFVFIGEIILNLEFDYNQVPEGDYCGSCKLCVEACPTKAILDNRTLNSERCISYQTIENRGEISQELEGKLSNRVFGCDICQDVCPWNRKAFRHTEPDFEPLSDLLDMTANEWSHLNKDRYRELFTDSPVERAGFKKLKSNIAFLRKKA